MGEAWNEKDDRRKASERRDVNDMECSDWLVLCLTSCS